MRGYLEQERLVAAFEIQRYHGRDAPRWLAERIRVLALAGDVEALRRFMEIAAAYQQLLPDRREPR